MSNDDTHKHRRSTDSTSDEIREMLKTNDPESELLLIILKVNDQVTATGEVLKQVAEQVETIGAAFNAHETAQKVSGGKTQMAWLITNAVLFPIIIAANGWALWAVKDHLAEDKAFHAEFVQVRTDVDLLQERLRIEDAMSKEKTK